MVSEAVPFVITNDYWKEDMLLCACHTRCRADPRESSRHYVNVPVKEEKEGGGAWDLRGTREDPPQGDQEKEKKL